MCPWSEGRVFIWEWNIRGLILFTSYSLHQFQNHSLYTAHWKTISLMCLRCRGKMFLCGENIWSSSPFSPFFYWFQSHNPIEVQCCTDLMVELIWVIKKSQPASPPPFSSSNSNPSVIEKPQQIRKPQSILLIYRQK